MNPTTASDRDANLMAALRDWRRETAAKFRVPVFYILHDRTLQLLVERKPLTLEGLLHIDGIAEVKTTYFGQELLELLETYLSPGERALKDYANSVPVQSCCHLCNASDSVMCPGCGVVHSNPHTNWSTTNSLLHQIKPGLSTESSGTMEELRPRKTNLSTEFLTKLKEELYCPLNAVKKQKQAAKREQAEQRVDEKSVETQRAYLKKRAEETVAQADPSSRPTDSKSTQQKRKKTGTAKKKKISKGVSKSTTEKSKGSSKKATLKTAKKGAKRPLKTTSQSKPVPSSTGQNGSTAPKNVSKKQDPIKKAGSTKRPSPTKAAQRTAKGDSEPRHKRQKLPAEPLDVSPDAVHLDKSFWDMASKVKKRAREALKKQEPSAKKRREAKKQHIPSWIGQNRPSTEAAVNEAALFEAAPDLETCPIPTLRKFLTQNGYKFPADIIDAAELRAMAKNSLPDWEVRRVLQCEKLPVERRYRAILRLTPTDGVEVMKRQFRKLSLVIHPDKNCLPDASHAFYLLQSALHQLSSLEKS